MISHYQHLADVEGMSFGKRMIIRGSLERLAHVITTAMTNFFYQEVPQSVHPRSGNTNTAKEYGYLSGEIQCSSG